jgi:hypothetical protein
MRRANLIRTLSVLFVLVLAATMIALGCGKRAVVSASSAAIALELMISLLAANLRPRQVARALLPARVKTR